MKLPRILNLHEKAETYISRQVIEFHFLRPFQNLHHKTISLSRIPERKLGT